MTDKFGKSVKYILGTIIIMFTLIKAYQLGYEIAEKRISIQNNK